jgi:chromate transporter
MNFLLKHKNSPRVKRMASYIKPTIAVLIGMIMVQNFTVAFREMGILHLIVLAGAAYYFLEKKKVHPSLVILGALIYGGVMGAMG